MTLILLKIVYLEMEYLTWTTGVIYPVLSSKKTTLGFHTASTKVNQRKHSKLGYQTPIKFEQEFYRKAG